MENYNQTERKVKSKNVKMFQLFQNIKIRTTIHKSYHERMGVRQRWIDAMKRDGKKYRRELRENMKKEDRSGETLEMLTFLGLVDINN